MLINIYYCTVIAISFILAIGGLFILWTPPRRTLKRTKDEEGYYDPNDSVKKPFYKIDEPPLIYLSVVIPAYNEENRLMLSECLEFLEKRAQAHSHFKYELIIVSDGSTDSTKEVALSYSKKYGTEKVRVLELSFNRGKGGAVTLGVESARGALILFADADGATKFPDIEKLELAIEKVVNVNYLKSFENAKTVSESLISVIGSRAHLEKEAVATRSTFRNFLMHGFHFLVWLLAVRTIRDTQCGFKLFTRRAARLTFCHLHVTRWAFDVELLYLCELLGVKMIEVAVRWQEIEGSKLVPVFSWLQMGKDLVLIWARYKFRVWRLKN